MQLRNITCTGHHGAQGVQALGALSPTFQGHPVVLPFPPGGRLHLLVLLVHQEVLDRQGTGLAHRALCGREQDVRLARGAQGAAALLVTMRGAGLLQALTVGAHLQLPSEILIHPLAGRIPGGTAATVAAHEGTAGGGRVAGVGGIGSPGQEVRVGGGPFNPTICKLTALTCVNILGSRKGENRRHASRREATQELWGAARGCAAAGDTQGMAAPSLSWTNYSSTPRPTQTQVACTAAQVNH